MLSGKLTRGNSTTRQKISQEAAKKKPRLHLQSGLWNKCLAVTYFRMGKPHTIIGDVLFHF